MTRLRSWFMLCIPVPLGSAGQPVGWADTTVTRHLSQTGSYQVTLRPSRPSLTGPVVAARSRPTGPSHGTQAKGQFGGRSDPERNASAIFTVWRETARRRGAMLVPWGGRRERPYP